MWLWISHHSFKLAKFALFLLTNTLSHFLCLKSRCSTGVTKHHSQIFSGACKVWVFLKLGSRCTLCLVETPTEAAASWFIMISSVQRKLEMVSCHKNSLLSPFTGPDLLTLLSHPDWILIFSDETSRNTGETWSHKAQRQKLVSLHQNKILQTYKHYYNRYVQPACATTGDGLYEGLTWLTSNHKSWSKGKIFCDSRNLFSSLFTFFRHC